MPGSKIVLLFLLVLFIVPAAFGQTEALKTVVNNLAYYKQRAELKYLSNAKKSVDSLIRTKSDSSNLTKNVYKAIVYSSIAYIDSANQLNMPADFTTKTVTLVDALAERKKIYKFQTELDFSKRCLANVFVRGGFLALKKKEFDNAIAAFRKAQTYAPAYAQLNAYIAYANNKAGNYQDAVKYYSSLLTADSTKTEDVLTVFNLYKNMGDTVKALQILQKGRKALPADKLLLMTEASTFHNQQDYRSLEPLLGRLLDVDGKNFETVFVAANCYDRLKKYDKAESLYLHAIELNKTAYNPVFNLGLLYLKSSAKQKGRPQAEKSLQRAELWLHKAYEMAPKNVTNLKLLQLVYAKTGNETELYNINNQLQQLKN